MRDWVAVAGVDMAVCLVAGVAEQAWADLEAEVRVGTTACLAVAEAGEGLEASTVVMDLEAEDHSAEAAVEEKSQTTDLVQARAAGPSPSPSRKCSQSTEEQTVPLRFRNTHGCSSA